MTSDTQIFQERAEALMTAFARSPTPRYLVADAKLYTEDNAATLQARLYHAHSGHPQAGVAGDPPSAAVGHVARLDATTRYHGLELCHYGMAQRWLVVSSQAAMERAEASVNKAQQREWEPSRSNSFTCKPNALRRLRRRKPP